jgi:D-tyrosyl-tRNA(Tyr) deacylase
MRAVVQRVKQAGVSIGEKEISRIGRGLLVYLGIGETDTEKDIEYLAAKIAGLRIFADHAGSMNLPVTDLGGSALVISQFTLYGDVRRGKRPSFIEAMRPEKAEQMYHRFAVRLGELGVPCRLGVFGAMMDIHSINDGPVTILLDSSKLF